MRLMGHAHGIVTKILHKIRFTFCLSKTGPCAIISSQISSKFHLGVNVVNCLGF